MADKEYNQYICGLSVILPETSDFAVINFQLHNKMWKLESCYNDGWLCVIVSQKSSFRSWDVQIGILDESGEIIVASKANNYIFTKFSVHNIIQRSKLEEIFLKNKKLDFFVRIEIKEDGKTKAKRASKLIILYYILKCINYFT